MLVTFFLTEALVDWRALPLLPEIELNAPTNCMRSLCPSSRSSLCACPDLTGARVDRERACPRCTAAASHTFLASAAPSHHL